MAWDDESASRKLTERSRPASSGRVKKLEDRVAELEKAVADLTSEIAKDRPPLQHSEW